MSTNESNGQPQDPNAAYGAAAAQAGYVPPPGYYPYPPPGMHPHYYGHPGMHHPHAHPQAYAHGYAPPPHPGMTPPHMAPPNPNEAAPSPGDPLFEQAQVMLEGALGEEAGMFKEILGSLGMSDKEFWKGAMVGAAAALLLSNENVRKNLMGLVSGAGDLLKSGGASVKESATQTATSVKQNVATGSEIFRDTYEAGREGFKESVERHQQTPSAPEATDGDSPETPVQPRDEQ